MTELFLSGRLYRRRSYFAWSCLSIARLVGGGLVLCFQAELGDSADQVVRGSVAVGDFEDFDWGRPTVGTQD